MNGSHSCQQERKTQPQERVQERVAEDVHRAPRLLIANARRTNFYHEAIL